MIRSELRCLLLSTPARADIVISAGGPMTGSNAAFGEQFRRGAERAVPISAKAECSANCLVTGDDSCDPKQAVSVANDPPQRRGVRSQPLLLQLVHFRLRRLCRIGHRRFRRPPPPPN